MSVYDSVNNIFNPGIEKLSPLKKKVAQAYATEEKKPYNPFLNKEGKLINKYIDYQGVLDNPDITKAAKKYITEATGLTETPVASAPTDYASHTAESGINSDFTFNANADANNLGSLDVATELPKLSSNQISAVISKYFGNSPVIKPSDAEGIFNAQQQTGMSALAILGIGALESSYGTSNIAKQKNNIWGWNATNVNPGGNATTFSQMSQGALEFANNFMKTYYNGYGLKSIGAAGSGGGNGNIAYAQDGRGNALASWAPDISSIMKNFYNTAKTVQPATASTGTGSSNTIVNTAAQYLDVPYVWGGTTPKGFDCSGLVQYVFKQNGINIPRVTTDQVNAGQAIAKSNLQPGDAVFFSNESANDHVGIYIGGGKFIHAPHTGDVVKVSDLNSAYYTQHYSAARRYTK